MKQKKRCSECGGSEIYRSLISSGGGHAPDLLPGAHPWWGGGKMEVYVCGTCGHFQFFVPPEYLQNVKRSKKFQKFW